MVSNIVAGSSTCALAPFGLLMLAGSSTASELSITTERAWMAVARCFGEDFSVREFTEFVKQASSDYGRYIHELTERSETFELAKFVEDLTQNEQIVAKHLREIAELGAPLAEMQAKSALVRELFNQRLQQDLKLAPADAQGQDFPKRGLLPQQEI